MKYTVYYKMLNKRRQRQVEAKDIYDAERAIRAREGVSERSSYVVVTTIKGDHKIYEVNGTVLGG